MRAQEFISEYTSPKTGKTVVDPTKVPGRDSASSNYAKLDRFRDPAYRNATKPRIDSVQTPASFNFPAGASLTSISKKPSRSIPSSDNSRASDSINSISEKFKEQAAAQGYDEAAVVREKPNSFFEWGVVTDNGLYVTVFTQRSASGDPNSFSLAVNRISANNKEAVANALSDFSIKSVRKSGDFLTFYPSDNKSPDSTLEDLWKMVAAVESLGSDFTAPGTARRTSSRLRKRERIFDYYRKMSKRIVDEYVLGSDQKALSRLAGLADSDDEQIVIGITPGGYQQSQHKDPYREHAVPCDAIAQYALDICESYPFKTLRTNDAMQKELVLRLAKMISRNLVLVKCSDQEREKIDFELGLIKTMPQGWNPETGDVLARFIAAKIPVYSVKDHKRIAEDNDF